MVVVYFNTVALLKLGATFYSVKGVNNMSRDNDLQLPSLIRFSP
jgi:hypothetical protein